MTGYLCGYLAVGLVLMLLADWRKGWRSDDYSLFSGALMLLVWPIPFGLALLWLPFLLLETRRGVFARLARRPKDLSFFGYRTSPRDDFAFSHAVRGFGVELQIFKFKNWKVKK